MPNRSPLILESEIEEIVPLSSVTRWREEKLGRFPKKVRISSRKTAYLRSEIEAWSKDPEGWRAQHAEIAS